MLEVDAKVLKVAQVNLIPDYLHLRPPNIRAAIWPFITYEASRFFGHRYLCKDVETNLHETRELIENNP